MARTRLFDRMQAYLVAEYEGGRSPAGLAVELGVRAQTIRQRLRRAGIKLDRSRGMRAAYASGRRSAAEHGDKIRKYTVDESVYERDLTPDSAWVLGVIIGDGCVTRRNGNINGVEVCGDEDVCHKVAAILGSNHPVRYLRGGCYAVRIYCKGLAMSLAAYGIGPAKTETVRLPEVPTHLLSHVMRGYWDADGCVTTRKQQRGIKRQLVLFSTTVSSGLALDVARSVVSVVDGSYGPYGKRKKIVSVSCNKAVTFGDWMWRGSRDENRGSRKHGRFAELRSLHG